MLKVKEIMRSKVPALKPDTSLADAVQQIVQSGLQGLPVIDDNRQLLGFLSEHDCLQTLMKESYHCDRHIRVAELMRRNPLYVSEELTVFALAQLMDKDRPKLFPVTRDERLVGLVTRGDVVQTLAESLQSCKAF